MAKYLLTASYTTDGAKGLKKDGGTKRRAAAAAAVESVGGKLESFYYAFGEKDVFAVADFPSPEAAVALSMAIASTGAVNARLTPLMTCEEMDAACKMTPGYRAPGA
jgi:uncharacterized protein with GYD domain